MDFQIGCCYWFLSRGMGRCLQWAEEIEEELLGLEKDSNEQLSSEPSKICKSPNSTGNKCKTRNCCNCRDEGCRMQMCAKCCIRIQRKTAEFNRKNPTKPRVLLSN